MKITGNLINAYFVCKRKAWFYGYQLTGDADNPHLELGRLIDQTTYQREKEGITKEGMKIDIIKKKDGQVIVAEIKKSSKFIEASKMQLVYYLLRLKEEGLNLEGELLFPKERKRIQLTLTDELISKLNSAIKDIQTILSKDKPPQPKRNKFCKSCAYFEFCFA